MAKIGLDYGHGVNTFPPSKGVYVDGVGYAEHSFNAKLGQKIKKLLEANGHEVIEGQPANKNEVGLLARTNLYNRENVDIVVSVHANANSNDEVDGRCVFYWHSSTKGKQLAESIVKEIKNAGYSTHGNGLHASQRGSWTNLHITRETKMPAVLVEYGFMTNDEPGIDDDFELLFGSKQEEYTDDMAEATVKAISSFFNANFKSTGKISSAPKKQTKSTSTSKSVSQMAREVIAGKHGSGHANRRQSLGVSQSVYEQVRAEVNRRAGVSTSSSRPQKSISQMAQEVIDGKHGNGHTARRNSLGISQSQYEQVRAEVNKRAGGSSTSGKSISQMATEVIRGDHGTGHNARRRSLGVSQSRYNQVRAEVNRRF